MTRPTCYHEQKNVVWSNVGNDGEPLATSRQLRHQCRDCGRLLPQALPHSLAGQHTPNIDIDALRRWISHDRGQLDRRRIESQQLERQRQIEWRDKYFSYLQSDAWKAKRLKVLDRCGGLCEGCRTYRALEVHHLSYENLGNELLWELRGVCRECHERAHKIPPLSSFSDAALATEKPTRRQA